MSSSHADIHSVLRARALHSVYQPIVTLDDEETVAYEALVRGPAGPLERPDQLFGAAEAAGCTGELDRAARQAAIHGASEAGLRPPLTLFVNVEPGTLDLAAPEELAVLADAERSGLRLVLELTERDLTARPAELFAMVERARELGWGVAVDDVGADVHSLALMPLLRPDVIKLDLRLVQERPSPDIADIVNAVNAEAEASGATLLAEGIETPQHAALAKSMGATLGQGWLYGRPRPLPSPLPRSGPMVPLVAAAGRREVTSPYELAAHERPGRVATKPLLLAMTQRLEQQAAALGERAVVISTFEHGSYFTPATARRYERLARRAAFVGALGEDLYVEPAPGVRGAHLDPDDPVRREWDVAVVGPHFAAALVARDLGDTGPEDERRFRYVLTYDRPRVIEITAALMKRVEGKAVRAAAHPEVDARARHEMLQAASHT